MAGGVAVFPALLPIFRMSSNSEASGGESGERLSAQVKVVVSLSGGSPDVRLVRLPWGQIQEMKTQRTINSI